MSGNDTFDRKRHWEQLWDHKAAVDTSWYQARPRLSLAMIARAADDIGAPIIDVGGGASLLVDYLLDAGYEHVSVLDISGAALRQARQRLGERAGPVAWIEADVTTFQPQTRYDIWHDRAAFHFLTEAEDRARYRAVLQKALAPKGQAIIAAFAPEGPRQCSGLDVVRYGAEDMAAELGSGFRLEEQAQEVHLTPHGKEQIFGFYRFSRI
jgi:trans-aconitate methyltransferase